MLEVFIFSILSWFLLALLPFKHQHHPSGVTFWGLLRVKIIRTPKVRIILVIIQVHFIFEHGFLLPGVFHKEFLVISHNVNDQIYTIIIAQPNLDNQIGAIERVDINPQPLMLPYPVTAALSLSWDTPPPFFLTNQVTNSFHRAAKS